MILNSCYNCCHEKICSYKEQFQNAVESVYNVSYATGKNDRYVLLKDSPILIEFKCPHYLNRKGGEDHA